MAIESKSALLQTVSVGGVYPEKLPELPQTVKDRFPELEKVSEDLDKLWADFRRLLTEQISDLTDPVNSNAISLSSLTETQTALEASVTAVTQQMESVAASLSSYATLTDVDNLRTELASSSTDLTDHISDSENIHGVAGDVVGTDGVQYVNNKTIGRYGSAPGYFSAIVNSSVLTGTVIIGSSSHMMVAGPFEVIGSLTINGYFQAIV